MPYSAEVNRKNPSCFLFLIDQSTSMADPLATDPSRSKAAALADAVNRLLQELISRCMRGSAEGLPHNYYDIGIVGYGANVGSAWIGALSGKQLVPIAEVATNARMEERRRRVEAAGGGSVEESFRVPIWIDPVAANGTPMCHAFNAARSMLEPWVQSHPNSFPPIVINVTDGEPTDGDIRPPADSLRRLSMDDGEVLLFNLHLSSQSGTPVLYPQYEGSLPNEFARTLFQVSSVLPPKIQDEARRSGRPVEPEARGFVFNADISEIIKFLDMGTRQQK